MKTKTAVAIRHIAFEDLGAFEPVLAGAGYEIECLEAGIGDVTSSTVAAAELLIVEDGPLAMRRRFPRFHRKTGELA